MTHRIKFAMLACTMVMASACAHNAFAATSLCPAGTKTVGLIQDSGVPGIPVEFPPDSGAYGESSVQSWDISAVQGTVQVQCNPNAEGFAGQTVKNIPAGSKNCQFDTATGNFSCTQ